LLHNQIIKVLEVFLSNFNKPVAEFSISYGCIMFYYYMPDRFTFEKSICGVLMGVFLNCHVFTSVIVERPKIIL